MGYMYEADTLTATNNLVRQLKTIDGSVALVSCIGNG